MTWLRFGKYVDGDIILKLLIDSSKRVSMFEYEDRWCISVDEVLNQGAIDLYLYIIAETGFSNFIMKLQTTHPDLINIKIWHEIWEII